MNITEVRLYLSEEERVKAYVTLVFEDCFIVHDIKIICREGDLFIAMPSRKMKDGSFKDIVHPVNADVRAQIHKSIMDAYAAKSSEARVEIR